ncbi:MAG: T9SS type A sorting domain-containing protein, partial [Bacteroidota bacterium]
MTGTDLPDMVDTSYLLYQGETDVRDLIDLGGKGELPCGFNATSMYDYLQQTTRAATNAPSLDPVGTPYTDVITAYKIGESRNAFSFIAGRDKQLSIVDGVGTNGGSISFIYRQNVDVCGGVQPNDNGRYRYSISTDGGQSWDVGSGVTVDAANGAPANHCFGKGTINPTYTRFSRYPNMAMFVDPAIMSPTTADLSLVFLGPVLLGTAGWDGHVRGTVSNLLADPPVVDQEEYAFQSGNQYLPASLIERVPGEFWYVANDGNDAQGDNIQVNKGVYNATTKAVDWSVVTTITPNHFVFDGGTVVGIPHIAFSPDGSIGWIAHPGDLVGGEDTTISPIFYESTDGGATWGSGQEFNMGAFPELADTLLSVLTVDSIAPGVFDTVPFLTGKASIVFQFELAVDAVGNPHYFSYVAGASSPFAAGGSASGYFFFPGIKSLMYDFTKDEFGDWNMLEVAEQSTYDASFGDLAQNDVITSGPKPEVSRTPDGNHIIFCWVDSDTTSPSYTPQADPGGGALETNTAPELLTRSYDVVNDQMSPIVNWTAGDANFGARALLPRPSYESFKVGDSIKTPLVFMDLIPGTSVLNPVSYIYIGNIAYDAMQDFNEEAIFFYNCKSNPIAANITEVKPDCGVSDGELSVAPAGGIGTLNIQWGPNAGNSTMPNVNGLAAGIYSVVITDEVGCTSEETFVLSNDNAPTLAVSNQIDITCNGFNDGTATITPTGGAGSEMYSWTNGEMAATATMLPPGTTTVTVTDANGCQTFTSVTINEPPALSITTSFTDIVCFGDGNGTASALAVGGTGNLSYSWSNNETTPSISNLAGGQYDVTVTDDNNCTIQASVTVSEPLELTTAVTTTDNTNATNPNGTAIASASGGTSPFTYNWVYLGTPPATFTDESFIFGLVGGDYEVTTIDANGCTSVDTITVNGFGPGVSIEDELTAGITQMQMFPNPNNGSFSLNLQLDRVEDVKIEVIGINGQTIASQELNNVVNVEQRFELNNVASGLYLVRVTTTRGAATQKLMVR